MPEQETTDTTLPRPAQFVATLRLTFTVPREDDAVPFAAAFARSLSPTADYPGAIRAVRVETVDRDE